MFQLENVNKIYKNKETEFKALDNISLEIADQEILSIIGTSGSGKTTVLIILSKVVFPFERAYKLQRYDVRYSNTV